MPRNIPVRAATVIALTIAGAAALAIAQDPFTIPLWAFPGSGPASPAADSALLHRVPHSTARYTLPQVTDRFSPPDWHPGGHPAMPEPVAHGNRPKLFACAFCHLPNGTGRPENARLAGLPETYIVAQLEAFRSSERRSPLADYVPGSSMHAVALNVTEAEARAAARYFSRLTNAPRVRVIETTRIPRMREAAFVYARASGSATDTLGRRIVEGPSDIERHELRDDELLYTAYVPPGSIRRGRSIATKGVGGAATACVTCHGPALGGAGVIPPLAGRYPTYVVRQLVGFKTGARSTPASQPMRAVAAGLSLDDIIAVAAYAGTLNTSPGARRLR